MQSGGREDRSAELCGAVPARLRPDPYGVFDLTEEEKCIGGDWFIRSLPDGKWIWEHDVPADIVKAVQARELQEEWAFR
jgi:hypothetical protein